MNLALGVLYSWSVFADALKTGGWTATQTQVPYMLACAVFAAMMVPAGLLQDRSGPKLALITASVLTGAGFVFSGIFLNMPGLLISFGIIFGTGMALGYSTTTPTAIKWFDPSHRGFISGVVVSGFGLAGIYVAPLTSFLIHIFALRMTFIILGVFFCVLIFLLHFKIRNPPEGHVPYTWERRERTAKWPKRLKLSTHLKYSTRTKKQTQETTGQTLSETGSVSKYSADIKEDYSVRQMLKTYRFYALWIMFFCGTFAGLKILGQLSSIGKEQGSLTLHGASVLVMIYALFNFVGRFSCGFLSDKLGRKVTLFIIFLLQVVNFALFSQFKGIASLSAGTACLAFSFGGMLSLFPSMTADYFGLKNLGLNYGIVFTAWGLGGVLGPLIGGMVRDHIGIFDLSYLISLAVSFTGLIFSLTLPPAQKAIRKAAQKAV